MTQWIRVFSLIVLAGGLLVASESADKKSKRVPPPSRPGSTKDPSAPPANAEKQPDGSYISTDAKGKRFVHKRTPFGWAKYEEKQTAGADKPEKKQEDLTRVVKDLGDRVRFEKPSPFGPHRWERKKAELSESEKAALDKFLASHR